jgi:hypothetical protein
MAFSGVLQHKHNLSGNINLVSVSACLPARSAALYAAVFLCAIAGIFASTFKTLKGRVWAH